MTGGGVLGMIRGEGEDFWKVVISMGDQAKLRPYLLAPILALLVFCSPRLALADSMLADAWDNGQVVGGTPVFPNWSLVHVGSFTVWEYQVGSDEYLTGLTVVNFGTALPADIEQVYFRAWCDDDDTGLVPMDPAGDYTVDSGTFPAWTWLGPSAADFSGCEDLCGDPVPCGAYFTIDLYVDIAPCPTANRTIKMGFPTNYLLDPAWPGSIYDNKFTTAPWTDIFVTRAFTIQYIHKEVDKPLAAPGDTLNYVIYVGRPGTVPSPAIVFDTLPAYTHLLDGSAVPPPDSIDPGPPKRLRWDLPAAPVTDGRTWAISFSLTVDWGNGDTFEPGSGDLAAPEGYRLRNEAQGLWPDVCGGKASFSPLTQTVVRRFLFWKVGNNDLLMAARLGYPDDEMIYEIFLKNVSNTKTWWNVQIYDTVPAELDVWTPQYGLEDLCLGWTMTPIGGACSPGNPGSILAGGNTILTWMMDLAPQQTASVRYRARLKSTVEPSSTIINMVSILALGKTHIVGGTGHSIRPASFTHLATVKLRTTYYSYNSWAAMGDQRGCAGFFISFYPLNVNTTFELRKLECEGSLGAAGGGKSDTISTYVGHCRDAFVADGAGNSVAGCGAERAPAVYWPGIWNQLICPLYWFNFLYKVTSNSPFLWMAFSETTAQQMDSHTFLPSTSLSYRGFMHYTTMRPSYDMLAVPGYGDRLAIINTSMNFENEFDPDLTTTTHVFRWNPVTLSWVYLTTGMIDPESVWMPLEGTNALQEEQIFHHRIISSDAQNLVYQGFHTFNAPAIGGAYDNFGTLAPTRETGNLVSQEGQGNFYFIANHGARRPNVVVGNTGSSRATFRIYRYDPLDASVPNANWPPTLAGSSGRWVNVATTTVEAGTGAGNPRIFMGTPFVNSQTYATAWKVQLLEGGPIQIYFGGCVYDSWSGGSNIHGAHGGVTGKEFWFHSGPGGGGFGVGCENPETYCVNVFCPKSGMAVSVESTGGWKATYTTDGPDQAIVWLPITSVNSHAYRFYWSGGTDGEMIAQYHQCTFDEKFLTAPFVETGLHYDVIAPPVVYVGQSFCITIVAVDSGGGTKLDYTGETSFTSSDPAAEIENVPMDLYDYDWTGLEEGVRIFCSVVLNEIGEVPIVAVDTQDGSISGLTAVAVVGVDVKFTKHPPLGIAASGDEVQFKICWSNYSTASATGFTITDAVPAGFTYVNSPALQTEESHFCGSTDGFILDDVTDTVAYSTTGNAPGDFSPIPDGGTAESVTWLRWTIGTVGVGTTGCVCFKAKVD